MNKNEKIRGKIARIQCLLGEKLSVTRNTNLSNIFNNMSTCLTYNPNPDCGVLTAQNVARQFHKV